MGVETDMSGIVLIRTLPQRVFFNLWQLSVGAFPGDERSNCYSEISRDIIIYF